MTTNRVTGSELPASGAVRPSSNGVRSLTTGAAGTRRVTDGGFSERECGEGSEQPVCGRLALASTSAMTVRVAPEPVIQGAMLAAPGDCAQVVNSPVPSGMLHALKSVP